MKRKYISVVVAVSLMAFVCIAATKPRTCTVDSTMGCVMVRSGEEASCTLACPSGNSWHPGYTCTWTVPATPLKAWAFYLYQDGGFSRLSNTTNCTVRCAHTVHYCSYEGCNRTIHTPCIFSGQAEPVTFSTEPGCRTNPDD
jgi:hypothetical protein